VQGEQGPTGKDFQIYKTYSSIADMEADAANVPAGDFVLITSNPEDPDNAKLYVRTSSSTPGEEFNYLTDMSGAQGMKGETGPQGPQGPQGIQGPQGEPGPTYIAGDAITISGDVISANINPPDFFTAGSTITGTGNPATIPNTIGFPLESVQLKGDTTQQTYNGKNLLIYPYYHSSGRTNRGITFTVNNDGTLTLNGQSDGTGASTLSFFANYSTPLVIKSGTYYFINPGDSTINFQIFDGTNYYGFSAQNGYSRTFASNISARQIYIQISNNSPTNFNNFKVYPMLTTMANPTVADYEPYVGGIPAPNPDYPQPVQVVTGEQTVTITDGAEESQEYEVNLGKNLLDMAATENGGIDANGADAVAADNWRTVGYISALPNTTYTYSMNGTLSQGYVLRFYQYDANYNFISPRTEANGQNLTATTRPNTRYIRLSIYSAVGTMTESMVRGAKLMLELGSTASSYASYFEPIELCKIGTYQDYIYKSGNDWYVHKATTKYTFDGSDDEQWGLATNSRFYCNANLYSGGVLPASNAGNFQAYCNSLTPMDYNTSWNSTTNYTTSVAVNNTSNPRIVNKDHTTLASFETWLSANPVTLYYPVITPTDIQITNADLVAQLEAILAANSYVDTTVLTVTSNDLPASLTVSTLRKSLAGIIEAIGR
jgi:hypothetical protein